MRNEKYFENVERVGDLYLDHIFSEYENEAIVFICRSVDGKLYLSVCTEIRYVQKWMLAEIHIDTLKDLISNKLDILSVFMNNEMLIEISMDMQGVETSKSVFTTEVDELDLPQKDVYLLCDRVSAYNYWWNQYAMSKLSCEKKCVVENGFVKYEIKKSDIIDYIDRRKMVSKVPKYVYTMAEKPMKTKMHYTGKTMLDHADLHKFALITSLDNKCFEERVRLQAVDLG